MAIAFVQAKALSGGTTSTAVAFTSSVTANNLLIVGIGVGDRSATCQVTSITDTLGNTYLFAGYVPHPSVVISVAVFYCVTKATGANTVTVNVSANFGGNDVHILEYSGLIAVQTVVLDKVSVGTSTSSTVVTAATVKSTTAAQLFFAFGDGGATLTTPGTGYTIRLNPASQGGSEDHIVAAITSEGAAMTFNASASFCIVMATFSATLTPTSVVASMAEADQSNGQTIGGRNWPSYVAAEQIEEMTAWTQRIILPLNPGSDLDHWQAHDTLGGSSWLTRPSARQLDGHEIGFNPSGFLPPFDPTVVPLFEQLDIPSPQYMMEWEDDSPLNLFLPPPGWDDGFDFRFQPQMKLEEYREEGALPIIPSAFDDDFLFSFQPQMKIDDERDYQMVIIIPRIVHDDDWTQNWQQSPMKIDDERDYQVRIFLPNQVLDDDWQMAVSPQMKLEEVDNGLLIILPPFDPTKVPQAEQMDSPDMRGLLRDDWVDSPLQLFLPPFDPTQRPAIEDGDYVVNAQARWVEMGEGRALEIFLPPAPWTGDEDNTQRPQPPANLSVAPEGEWFNLVVVLPVPPPGPIPGQSAFLLVRGVHIKR